MRATTRLSGILAALTLLTGCAALSPQTGTGGATLKASPEAFPGLRASPPLLRAFLRAMPKGADLHNHLSGAVYAENYIDWAAQDGLCIDIGQLAIADVPCTETKVPATQGRSDYNLRRKLIQSLSSSYQDQDSAPEGHDQFFATFGRFGLATNRRSADMLAEVIRHAAAQNVLHLELMLTLQGDGAQTLVKKTGWTSDFAAQRQRLVEAGLDQVVAAARKNLDDLLARQQALMGCSTSAAEPGCAVSVRFLQQASRVKPKEQVFALLAIGFALAEIDPRVVGVNLVSPEDSPVALADYTLHMEMIRNLALTSPKAGIALHAGELVLGLVPPDDLRFHIRQAVEIAGAKRIGHGVAVMEEDQPLALLNEMARRNVLVEINLTSNDSILGVKGAAHPFPVYRAQGVPVTLSTDDEGVSRNDLSREYQRAIETYDLSYGEMKEISRNGLEYSFLAGPSLWRSTRPFQTVEACANLAAPSCESYVGTSDKARRQRDLEQAWDAFDRRLWPVMQ